ncbi:granulocyte colony-stimulating factor receptor isoform X2 [Labeo rohita]|uniref:granulocyte colony-stimulating factor receptor isoform X2 n=1 Tax=Labeo rohita TaxID=84645 RepID=UPI0021E2840A|nr:granulocyte colony-stimulating factor receptor isoform X2 [Labeo rohita]
MRMIVAVLVLLVSVSLTEAGCVSTSSPRCYKKSTRGEEDFTCEWDKRNPEKNQIHTVYVWNSEKKNLLTRVNAGNQSQTNILLEELGIVTRKTDIWVQTQLGNLTCNSSKISVILECMVKYSKPQIIRMNRSAGILDLTLDKPQDGKSATYEIRWRERDSEWQNATFETEHWRIPVFNSSYQIQLRRQAKVQSPLCKDSLHALWSDWSPVVDVPLEIRNRPVIRWVQTNQANGTRHIKLSWDAPPANESVGGVSYTLNLTVWPCKKHNRIKHSTVNQTYNTSITYSKARISLITTNKVGSSPQGKLFIPAVKHLNYCDYDMPSHVTKANKKTCLEWYKLEDGETRPETVNHSSNYSFKDIKNTVDKFVRHYYFLHTKRKGHYQTAIMCPFYSKQKAPKNGPDNEHLNISDITHESAVVSWLPIPVVEQQGFLQHYVIWISRQGNTKFHKVPANTTSFLIKELQPGASYTVSIAGSTEAGNGPNSTVNFETNSKGKGLSWQDRTILAVCVLALLGTLVCSVAARRVKLLPEVPSPVIDTTEFRCPEEQDLSQVMEEVHEFVLLLRQDLSKPRENMTPEQSTLLQDFGLVVFDEEDEEDEEGEVTDFSSVKSCFYPNPSYRGQTLHLPEPFHMTDSTSKDNVDTESTYKNGLFFETRVLECDKMSLQS